MLVVIPRGMQHGQNRLPHLGRHQIRHILQDKAPRLPKQQAVETLLSGGRTMLEEGKVPSDAGLHVLFVVSKSVHIIWLLVLSFEHNSKVMAKPAEKKVVQDLNSNCCC